VLTPQAELARLLEEKRRRQAEASLAEFIRQAWPILEPATPLLWNDHLDFICDDLEVASDAIDPTKPPPDEPIRDVYNMPPRYMKSSVITVMWPVWEWGPRVLPFSRWLFGSFNAGLATFHSVCRRTIIESAWYQQRWGHVFQLSSDQNVKTEFTNSHRGAMLSTGLHGSRLGRGGVRVIIDDAHDPENVLSDDVRDADIRRLKQGFTTRLDNKRRGAIINVQQRLHEADASAHFLALGYRHTKFENPCTASRTMVSRKGRHFARVEGALLWPEREDAKAVAEARVTLGPYGFAGQYLQEPSPIGGVIFQREWWRFYDTLPGIRDGKAASLDCAFKGTDDSDFVGSAVGVFAGALTYILEVAKERLTYPGTKALVRTLRGRHPDASHIYVEDKANGPAVIDDMRDQITGLIAVDPQGGKIARAHAASGDVEAGNVLLPQYLDAQGVVLPGREWVPDFIDRMAKFPRIAHDDDVDAFTQLIIARRNSTHAILDHLRREAEAQVAAESAAAASAAAPDVPARVATVSVDDAMKVFGR
jgi:predicted phage terminase large subunit-like protein